MTIKLKVCGNLLAVQNRPYITSGNIGSIHCEFDFDNLWDNLIKTAVFYQDEKNVYHTLLENNECYIPSTAMSKNGMLFVGIFGSYLDGEELIKRLTTNFVEIWIDKGSYIDGVVPPEPDTDIYNQILAIMQKQSVDAYDAQQAQIAAEEFAETAEEFANLAEEAKNQAETSAENALMSEGKAKTSEINAGESETISTQALSDLLAMLGADVATLTDGKLTPSQIPPLSINDVFEVDSVEEMLQLTAERGDVALVLLDDNIHDSYMLSTDDPTLQDNWKKLGVSYVANSGHALTADNAVNADKINNKRIVGMTQSQYDSAVLNDDTYYFIVPDDED